MVGSSEWRGYDGDFHSSKALYCVVDLCDAILYFACGGVELTNKSILRMFDHIVEKRERCGLCKLCISHDNEFLGVLVDLLQESRPCRAGEGLCDRESRVAPGAVHQIQAGLPWLCAHSRALENRQEHRSGRRIDHRDSRGYVGCAGASGRYFDLPNHL